jgi:hypothetical protein
VFAGKKWLLGLLRRWLASLLPECPAQDDRTILSPPMPGGCLRCRHSERRSGEDVSVAGQQDRPGAVETESDKLVQRMERLPPGHPSSPYDEDGTRKPPVARPTDRELPLPDERNPDANPAALGSSSGEVPDRRFSDTRDLTAQEPASPNADGQEAAGQESLEGKINPDDVPEDSAPNAEARTSETHNPEAPQPDSRSWWEALPHFKEEWKHHEERWPQEQHPQVDRSQDEPGSWRGDGGRPLSARDNASVDACCDRIAKAEDRITSRVEDTERASAGGLVGKEFRLKERDSLKDKVAAAREGASGADFDRILANVHDAVRYTLQYDEADYTEGVQADVGWLKGQGFDLVRLKNFWNDAEYKGINSQWHDGETGQTFEMQFHTPASFAAKQITHKAYERIRNPQTTKDESRELHDYQREVSSRFPIPIGAPEIPEYP